MVIGQTERVLKGMCDEREEDRRGEEVLRCAWRRTTRKEGRGAPSHMYQISNTLCSVSQDRVPFKTRSS